ncbi:hypothetical protein V6N13_087952 [Hibiscus sabdariffa]
MLLRRLMVLELRGLPELKSICSVDAVVVCDSLKRLEVVDCLKLKRMPLKLPQLDNVQAHSPLSLVMRPKEWRESVEWDHPNVKSRLEPLMYPYLKNHYSSTMERHL